MLIPYIIWPLTIFIIDNIYNHKFIISWYQLKIQIITGRQFMIPLWYLFSLIFLTLFFFIISIIFKNHFLFFLQLLAILIYIAQYSKFYNVLNIYKLNVRMPISVFGLTFASTKIIKILKRKIIINLFFSYL